MTKFRTNKKGNKYPITPRKGNADYRIPKNHKTELLKHKWVEAKMGTTLPYKKVVLLGIKGDEAHIEWNSDAGPVDAHINIKHLRVIKK